MKERTYHKHRRSVRVDRGSVPARLGWGYAVGRRVRAAWGGLVVGAVAAPRATGAGLVLAARAAGAGAVDVAEIFSPRRFTAGATKIGLRPGFAADLVGWMTNDRRWDLSKPKCEAELERRQKQEDPYLLTGSPPCGPFSQLQSLNPETESKQQRGAEGKRLLKVATRAYWRQLVRGRYFLHEHPGSATSWYTADIQTVLRLESVDTSRMDQCQYGAQARNG